MSEVEEDLEVRVHGKDAFPKAQQLIRQVGSRQTDFFTTDPEKARQLQRALSMLRPPEKDYTLFELGNWSCLALVKPGRGPSGWEALLARLLGWALAILQSPALRWLLPWVRSWHPLLALADAVPPSRVHAVQQFITEAPRLRGEWMKATGVTTFLHLYLIATLPAKQGKGLGSVMLRHLTQLADEEGEHIYLQASNARNRALYLRHGFVDFAQYTLRGSDGATGTTFTCMARAPQARAATQ